MGGAHYNTSHSCISINFGNSFNSLSLVFYMPQNLEEDADFSSEHCIIKKKS